MKSLGQGVGVLDHVKDASSRARLRAGARISALSAAVLIPCLWQSRIQAGDLSSHLYNAWLASLAAHGRIGGVELVPQWTNIGFDLVLRWLLTRAGAAAAERIAVAAAVLIFFWGAFAFVKALTRRAPWGLAPLLAMLAYGWVFHVGFFNFYVSLGLCLWALALAWKPDGRRLAAAAGVGALAAVFHPLPVAWAGAMVAYIAAARCLAPRRRLPLALIAAACIILLRRYLFLHFDVFWSADQARHMTGADQLYVFGPKFAAAAAGVLAIWLFLFIEMLQTRRWTRLVLGIPFQLCLLTSAGILYLPGLVVPPGVPLAFQFIPERMSLALAVLVCALVGRAPAIRPRTLVLPALAAAYFMSLYLDTRALNRVEDQVTEAISVLPPGQRVISSLCKTDFRMDPLLHMVDRACIGRCFSYGNYEPSSWQFSVRASRRNPVVAWSRDEIDAIETGHYIVKHEDLPLYELALDDNSGRVVARELRAGDIAGRFCTTSQAPGVSARLHTASAGSAARGERP